MAACEGRRAAVNAAPPDARRIRRSGPAHGLDYVKEVCPVPERSSVRTQQIIKIKRGNTKGILPVNLREGLRLFRRGEDMATARQKKKVEKVMHEYKDHRLKSGSGKKAKSRKQAIAIAMSESGQSRKRKKAS
jgi:hypothetical protein